MYVKLKRKKNHRELFNTYLKTYLPFLSQASSAFCYYSIHYIILEDSVQQSSDMALYMIDSNRIPIFHGHFSIFTSCVGFGIFDSLTVLSF